MRDFAPHLATFYQARIRHWLIIVLLGLLLPACAGLVPVQEMSNARQSLQAAQEANAQLFAPDLFNKADSLIKQAEKSMESGDFSLARGYALQARETAIRARQYAISKQ